MVRRISCAVALLTLINAVAHASGARVERSRSRIPPAAGSANVKVQLIGFPLGTQFKLDASATYQLIEPMSVNPPRGVNVPLSDSMVKKTIPARKVVSVEKMMLLPGTLEETLEFAFDEPLAPPRAGTTMLAYVLVPISFAYSDVSTNKMRQMRKLATVPLRVDGRSPLSRCFRIEAIEDAIHFRVVREGCDAPTGVTR